MIEAKDVLFIVLAFCALWFTAFVCWLIFQITSILKNVNDTISDVRTTLGKMEKAIAAIKDRFDHATSGVTLLFDHMKKLVDFLAEAKGTVKRRSRAKNPSEIE